jgi:hypothetical protein
MNVRQNYTIFLEFELFVKEHSWKYKRKNITVSTLITSWFHLKLLALIQGVSFLEKMNERNLTPMSSGISKPVWLEIYVNVEMKKQKAL